MNHARTLLSGLVLAACTHAGTPATGTTTAQSCPMPDTSPSSASSSPAAFPGNAAVQARLAPLPAPPSPWSTPVATLTPDDFVALCPYLVANGRLEGDTVTCPDGSTATIAEHECDPNDMSEAARSLPCTISLGEIVACRLAMVEHPCEGGPLGENLEECRAFDACTCTSPRAPELTRP